MMKTKRFFLMMVFAVTSVFAMADSPLTSCSIYKYYQNVTMVKTAGNAKNINQTIMAYLANKNNPIATRMAVVYTLVLGTDPWPKDDTQEFPEKYLEYLKKRNAVTSESALIEKIDGPTLMTYAYMLALANYADEDVVANARMLSEQAISKDQTKSLTVRLIGAVITGQYWMSSDWGMVYRDAERVINDGSLKKDMKQDAVNDIWNYLKAYKDY